MHGTSHVANLKEKLLSNSKEIGQRINKIKNQNKKEPMVSSHLVPTFLLCSISNLCRSLPISMDGRSLLLVMGRYAKNQFRPAGSMIRQSLSQSRHTLSHRCRLLRRRLHHSFRILFLQHQPIRACPPIPFFLMLHTQHPVHQHRHRPHHQLAFQKASRLTAQSN